MTNYPYYIAVRYDAGLLKKIKFGVQNGRKFDTWSDCAGAVKRYYKNFPQLKDEQILILEYANQYVSKIMDICKGDEWTSVESPIKLM